MSRSAPPGPAASLGHQAAWSFHAAASAVLRGLDKPSTQTAVAEIVGSSVQAYSDALAGRRVSLDRVAGWCAAWRAAGLPPLEVVVRPGADAPVVVRASGGADTARQLAELAQAAGSTPDEYLRDLVAVRWGVVIGR